MTTRAQPLPALFTPARGFPWRQMVLAFLLTLLALAVFALAFAAGYASLHAGRALPGVHVGGVSLAGLDRPSAEAALREQLPSLGSGHLTVSFADVQERIIYSSINRDYDMAAMLDQAFAVGHNGALFDQLQDQLAVLMHGINIQPQMGWNQQALEERIGLIAAATYVEPRNARIERNGAAYVVVPSSEGRTVDLQAALAQAMAAVDNLSAADGVVRVAPTPLLPEITTAQAQAAVDRIERVVAAEVTVTGGGTTATMSADNIRGWVRLEEAAAGEWQLFLEREPIAQWIAALAAETDQPPIEASFAFKGGEVVAVAGQTGQQVDVEASTDAVYGALLGRADGNGPPTPTVHMSIAITEPEFTTEEAEASAPLVENVSEWTTRFSPGEANFFGNNIHIPADHLDGTVIPPGGKFDFWGLMPASLGELEGVGEGGIIIRGRTVIGAIGGGICSVSTTIFNAAARAGLDIGARKAHSFYIDRYPVGLDATVWRSKSAQQNMTFFNDTDYPLLIRTVNRRGSVTFQIWTVPINRKVTFSEPRVENRTAAKDYLEYTDDLAPGERKRIEYPRPGFESWVTRTVTDANGNELHKETFYSKYRTVHGITLVGRGEGDPPAGTKVER